VLSVRSEEKEDGVSICDAIMQTVIEQVPEGTLMAGASR
jgi:hypothetical protein